MQEQTPTPEQLDGAWIALFYSVAGGVAVRAKLSLDYSKWLAVAAGLALAFAIDKLPLAMRVSHQSLLMLGALSAASSLLLAAIVYRLAIALAPLGELQRLRKESSDLFKTQDQMALSQVSKKFADDVEESGFLGDLLRAMAAKDFERAAKLANSRVRRLEYWATWQFALVVVSGLCLLLVGMLRIYCDLAAA
jgi:hypothetical protein